MKKKLDLQTLIQKFIAIIGLIKRNKIENLGSHVKFPFLLIAPAPGNDTEVSIPSLNSNSLIFDFFIEMFWVKIPDCWLELGYTRNATQLQKTSTPE